MSGIPVDKDTFDKTLRSKEVVYAFLKEKKQEGGGYRPPEIANEIGIDGRYVDSALEELLKEKKIQRIVYKGNYHYRCV